MREMRHRHRLQPHAAGAGERRQEDAVAAEQRVLDARDGGDVELHALLVYADVPRVDPQGVARLQVICDDLAVELYPGAALALQALHAKAGAAEYAGAESLLETDRELHARGRAHEAVTVHEVAGRRRDLHRQDLARELGREGEQPRAAGRRVLGHEERAAGDRPPEGAEETALLPAGRGRRLHLDRHRHPRQLAGLGENLVARLHVQLEDRQNGADDLWLHRSAKLYLSD